MTTTETDTDNKTAVDNDIIDTLVECYCENDDFCTVCKNLGLHQKMLAMKPGECTAILKDTVRNNTALLNTIMAKITEL